MHKAQFFKNLLFYRLAEHFKKFENIIFNICFKMEI